MRLSNFLYRQKQKWKYHTAKNSFEKNLAEINRFERKVEYHPNGFFVKQLNLVLPHNGFEFLFELKTFKLFISNAQSLSGVYSIEENDLLFTFDNFKFCITSRSELYIINEIFIENCYKILLPEDQKCIVIDVGMNVALASVFFASLKNVQKVYAYEPFKPTYMAGLRNIDLNKSHIREIAPNLMGLGLNGEEREMPYESKNKGINSSLQQSRKVQPDSIEKIIIEKASTHITRICQDHPESSIILKIDTEGAEYHIIDSLSQSYLPQNLKVLIIEWHFDGAEKIERYLLQKNFKIISTTPNQNSGLIYAIR